MHIPKVIPREEFISAYLKSMADPAKTEAENRNMAGEVYDILVDPEADLSFEIGEVCQRSAR